VSGLGSVGGPGAVGGGPGPSSGQLVPAGQAAAVDSQPHWGRQTSLFQPREPAFWLYLVLLAIGGYLFYADQSLMSTLTTAYVLSWTLVLVYAIPVAFVIYRLDLFEREPAFLIAAAVIWGGIVATSLAAEANSAWLSVFGKVATPEFTAQWGKAFVGPGVEETLKLMGVVILYLVASSEFDGPMDGFVYGAMVGLGFTVVEDVSYFINAVASAPGAVDQSGPVFDTFIIRVVGGGLYGHVLFTGLTGLGFAYLVTRRAASSLKRIGAAACIVAGVAAHFVWNSPWMDSLLRTTDGSNPSTLQWVEYGSVKGLPFLLLLGVLVILATRSEENNFRAIVAGEPDPDVINESEIRSLRSLLARRSARMAAKRAGGPAGAKLMGRLQSAQIEYAMVRSRSQWLGDPELEQQRQRIREIRAQLQGLPPTIGTVTAYPAPITGPVPGLAVSSGAAVDASMPTTAERPVEPAPLPNEPADQGAAAEPADEAPEAAAPEDSTADRPEVPAVATIESAVAAALSTQVPPALPARVSPPAPVWAPTHLVPPGGMPAWLAPDPSHPPMVILAERLDVVVEGWVGAWAHVRAVNGWRGWVDGRLLIPMR
jgi:protease PrsW